MAQDIIGKGANIAELGLIVAGLYIVYKMLSPLAQVPKIVADATLPDKTKPVILQPTPVKTVVDLIGGPGAGPDMLRGYPSTPVNVGTMVGELLARPENQAQATLLTSPANPLFYTTNTILNLFGLGYKSPIATKVPASLAPVKVGAPVVSVVGGLIPVATTKPSLVIQYDDERLANPDAAAVRQWLLSLPAYTPIVNGSQTMGYVYGGGVLRLDKQTYYPGFGGTSNTPEAVYNFLHPTPEQDPTGGINGYINPDGSLVATGSTPPAGSTPIINTNVETKYTPVQPVTAYVPPPTPIDSVSANPAMGSTPGIVYVNWQNYQVSKVPITGFGWMQMTEAEARQRGFIK